MITTAITSEKINNWKKLFDRFSPSMLPNRKTGKDVDAYFRNKYLYKIMQSEHLITVVKENIIRNDCFKEKLLKNEKLDIRCYSVDDVIVGIDITTGYFQVESKNTEKMISIYNDLFVYRGLDCIDLKNYVLVGQYLELTQK